MVCLLTSVYESVIYLLMLAKTLIYLQPIMLLKEVLQLYTASLTLT